jgi:hypothetical protein
MRWLNAICEYHKNGNISEAFDSIEKGFSNRKDTPKNKKEIEIFLRAIDNYKVEIVNREFSLINSREPVNIELNPQIKISGMIPAIFMKPTSGFSAYFIGKNNPNWETELRFPTRIQERSATGCELKNT